MNIKIVKNSGYQIVLKGERIDLVNEVYEELINIENKINWYNFISNDDEYYYSNDCIGCNVEAVDHGNSAIILNVIDFM